MKVLVVGFCKTGTKSVEVALKTLGYNFPNYLMINFNNFETWKKYMEGRGTLKDLEEMYKGVEAIGDMPCHMYWEDFLQIYPKLKLILMIRDEDDWLKSWKKYWVAKNTGILSTKLAYFSPTARKYLKLFHMEGRAFFNAPPQSFRKCYEGIPDETLKRVYRQHNQNILENAPPDQLLVLDYKMGWKQLCKFLDKEIPDMEFPHLNKGGGLIRDQHAKHPLFKQMYYEMYMAWTIIFVALLFTILFFMFYF